MLNGAINNETGGSMNFLPVSHHKLISGGYAIMDDITIASVPKLCKCGCGEAITVLRHHQWRGVPDYVRGHSSRIANGMKGKHHTEEALKKMSVVHLGKQPCLGRKSSEETKKKVGEASKKAWLNPEYRKFHEEMNIGRKMSESQKKAISLANTGRVRSAETCRKIGEAHKGKVITEEQREKLREAMQGRVFSDEHRQKISDAKKENFKDPEFCKKMGIAWGMKPNKPEKLLTKLLDRMYPGEWKYTGDFSFTINGKCPDFVNCNGQKKCIEIFGDYWHFGDNPQDRVDTFSPFGFDTLVIWEKELKDIGNVAKKIQEFHEAAQ